MQYSRHHHSAFTLVEMSIVLAIIGLIVGAIFAGTSVLKQSELQTVIADYTKYSAASAQFTQQYGSLPGDILDATNYWGKDTANCNADTQPVGSPGTCNGNGDGIITESVRAWQHLVLAKLIDGNYAGSGALALGTTIPRSRISGAGWNFMNNAAALNGTDYYAADISNFLEIGVIASDSNAVAHTLGASIKTDEAWQIDKKIDDSLPASGRVLATKPGPSTLAPNCTTSAVDATAAYNITYQGIACSLMMSLTTK